MAAKAIKVDEVSATLTYIGEGPVGALGSQPVWRVTRVEVVGTITSITHAGGNTGWNSVWDDRATLNYS